jgi:hypothetical protein
MKDVKNLNPSLIPILQAIEENFLKYYEKVLALTIIITYLHMLFKKKYVVLILQRYNNNLRLLYTEEEARVTNLLDDIFNIYNFRWNINQVSSSDQNIEYA